MQPTRLARAITLHLRDNSDGIRHFLGLLEPYVESSLRPTHILPELETGRDEKFRAAVWEGMLYNHFTGLGMDLYNGSKASGQNGPDFSFDLSGKTVRIEAVVPGPQGIPKEYVLPPNGITARRKPDKERVLRCTSAIADKQKAFARYSEKGIVGPDDALVIAVNICCLSDWDPDGNGVSQRPLCMEAVLPIGPMMIPMNRLGRIDGPPEHMVRHGLEKPSGVEVSTTGFLDLANAAIGAVIQAHQRHLWRSSLSLAVIHNPLAANRVPEGICGANREFVGKKQGDEYLFRDILAT